MTTLNYLQLRIPVGNADLVFSALAEQYGVKATDITLEEAAKLALIKVCDNAVTEKMNREALLAAQENKPDLGIA